MSSKRTKHNQIKHHLISGRTITGLTALSLYGVYRLSSVINRLRNSGLLIHTDKREDFARYSIKKMNLATSIDSLFVKL